MHGRSDEGGEGVRSMLGAVVQLVIGLVIGIVMFLIFTAANLI